MNKTMERLLTLMTIIATVFVATNARDIPEFLHICKKNDPNLNACITQSVEYLRPHLSSGLPEYNIPSLEPLALKEVFSDTPNIKLKLKDVKVHGASNFTVSRLKINLNTLRFAVQLKIPKLSLHGTYEVDGKVILLKIKGSGPVNGNFTDCTGIVKLQAELSKGEDGNNYLKITDFKTMISVKVGSMKFDNLFGDVVLSDALNTAINSNFDAFFKDLQPSIEQIISDTFLEIANSILSQFTYAQLFPDS